MTLNRFHYAYTRRQAHLPPEERPVLRARQAALNQRLAISNHDLVDLFIRTRRQSLSHVILDLDATNDPTHGEQYLALFHGYFDQYQSSSIRQYLPCAMRVDFAWPQMTSREEIWIAPKK